MHIINTLLSRVKALKTVLTKKSVRARKCQIVAVAGTGCKFSLLFPVSVIPQAAAFAMLMSIGVAAAQTESASVAEATNSDASHGSQQEYLISPDDLLDVYIVDVAELSRTYRVSPTGQVSIPLLSHPLGAAGLTLGQFSDLIAEELRARELVTNPQVTVGIKESRTHSVAITGAVKRPQLYFVFGRTTILDAISQAEGLADDASSFAYVSRGKIGQHALNMNGDADPNVVSTVDLEKLLHTGDPDLNIDIYPGDRVMVAPAGVIYVVGAVNKPGGFALTANRKRLTVLQAVALAEDVKSTAKANQAMIVRRDPQHATGREEIPVNLKDVLAGKAADVPLQVEDILFVPDNPGKKVALRGVEAAIQTATGVAIYHSW